MVDVYPTYPPQQDEALDKGVKEVIDVMPNANAPGEDNELLEGGAEFDLDEKEKKEMNYTEKTKVKEDIEDIEDIEEKEYNKTSGGGDDGDVGDVDEGQEENREESQESMPGDGEELDHELLKEQDQTGGAARPTMEYKINYLVPDDEELVNPDKIKQAVKRYIDNYHSDAMKKYRQLFKTVYQKYSSKRYIIDNNDTEIIVSKPAATGGSKTSKREIVYEVSKPGYIFYNKDNNLITMKTIISNKRQELLIHYQSLVNKLDVQPEEKKQFEKERKQFIDLLERYYIFNLYHMQINNINLEGKAPIIIQELHGFLKENNEKQYTLDGNLHAIDNTLIEKINLNNSSRLSAYNDLMIKLQSVKLSTPLREKIIEQIKDYLKSNDENEKINNEIKQIARDQNNYIDYIISRVPNN
jgi:hypothetical protein